jgi:hypothetical protein
MAGAPSFRSCAAGSLAGLAFDRVTDTMVSRDTGP